MGRFNDGGIPASREAWKLSPRAVERYKPSAGTLGRENTLARPFLTLGQENTSVLVERPAIDEVGTYVFGNPVTGLLAPGRMLPLNTHYPRGLGVA